ncbi:hypothetical protein CHIBA101_0572 [Actinomyces sp. Chiba101]|nr:hypothetical protein CHIBA101_0572 [Actinomyces sp. Chiba101]GAV94616.1 hypothetical protein ADENT20671_1385 [Actinomyces denticolens]
MDPIKGIYDYVTDSHGARTYKLPKPKSHTVEGGVRGSLSGSAKRRPSLGWGSGRPIRSPGGDL